MSKVLKSAVVGCGAIGPTHARSLQGIENGQLVAVCDIIAERAQKVADQYPGVAVYTDFDTMLKECDFDILHVCLPSGMHADFGCAGAKAGKHIITEKPIDVTLEAADRLIKTCKDCGVTLSTISQHRFDPDIAKLKEWVDEGKLGRLTTGCSHTKWYRSQEYYDSGDWRGTWALDGGGALMNQSVHYVDMLQHMMGEVDEVSAVWGTLTHERIEVEDIVLATLKFKSGALGILEGNTTCYPGFSTRLDVYGTKGGVVIEGDQLKEYRFEGEKWTFDPSKVEEKGGAGSAAIRGNSHQRQIQDVINAINEGRQPKITGESARHPLAVILAVYESARTGKWVKVK